MGLFEKLKNAVTSSKNSTPITYQQSKKLSYVPSYHIEDWQRLYKMTKGIIEIIP